MEKGMWRKGHDRRSVEMEGQALLRRSRATMKMMQRGWIRAEP